MMFQLHTSITLWFGVYENNIKSSIHRFFFAFKLWFWWTIFWRFLTQNQQLQVFTTGKKAWKVQIQELEVWLCTSVFLSSSKQLLLEADFWVLKFTLFKFSYLYKNNQGLHKTNVNDLNNVLICPTCIQQAQYNSN